MNAWLFTTNQTLTSLGPSLANHLWQSTAFALAAWLLTLALRGNHARVRHALWIAASIKFLVPFSLLIAAGNLLPHPRQAVAPVVYSAMDVVEEPFAVAPPLASPQVHVPTLRERAQAILPAALAALWLAGAAIVLFGWWNRWRIVSAALRAASPATQGRELHLLRRVESQIKTRAGWPILRVVSSREGWVALLKGTASEPAEESVLLKGTASEPAEEPVLLKGTASAVPSYVTEDKGALAPEGSLRFAHTRRPLPLLLSSERIEPGIFGVLRPVLVWPRHLSARLDDEHIEAILAHEFAHVRRHDNLTALLHMLVEAAFWFHPLVWWMERQIVKEREQACDEAVVALAAVGQLGEGHVADSHVAKSQSGDAKAFAQIEGQIDRQTYAEIYAEALLQTCRFCIESPLACVAGVTGADLRRRVHDIVAIVNGRALLRISWPKKLLLAAAAVSVIAAPIVLGQAKAAQRLMLAAINAAPKPLQSAAHAMMAEEQTPSAGLPSEAQPVKQDDTFDPCARADGAKFDVVSIKPSKVSRGDWDSDANADSVTLSGTTKALIQESFGLRDFQVIGGPDWASSDTFDIKAKFEVPEKPKDQVPSQGDAERWKERYRSLLSERYSLQCHMTTKELPAYDLVVAKGGPKMKSASVDNKGESSDGKGGAYKTQVVASGVSSGHITAMLARYVDRTVIDKTGLTGKYDFTLNWSTEKQTERSQQDGAPPLPDLPTALEEQLGLKLVPAKGPVPILVIDHIEKPAVDGAEIAPTASFVPVALAQDKPAPPANTADATTLAFDVVSIRQNVSGSREMTRQSAADADDITMTNVPLALVIFYAYWINDPNLVAGIPPWAWSERYDVTAKVAPENLARYHALTGRQRAAMLQAVLSGRFKLQVHHESKDQPVYALVVAKGGPKIKEAQPGEAQPNTAKTNPNGFQKGATIFATGPGQSTAEATSMSELALSLSTQGFESLGLGRPVVDQTGLTGRYDFKLQTPPVTSDGDDAQQEKAASLSDALQDQLGLRLQPSTAPTDLLIIDHIERPTAN